jgi:hypothetical protein
MNNVKPLLIGLVFLAGVFYLYAIVNAGILSLQGKGELQQLLSSGIIVIGGILSTNLGAVVGYSFKPPGGAARASIPKPFLGLRSTVNSNKNVGMPPPGAANAGNIPEAENTSNQKAQIFACYFYVVSLVIAIIFYFIASSKGNPLPVLEELSKTFLGVLVGALTVSLAARS